ncbi:MAG: hypothetical protein IPO08_04200 [Xanthomonadales bacterium]|nr:hypothetical protein [Xanthomonadales bacterium]
MEDAISGLTYMEARYYDPVAMRFISPDPVGVSGSNGGNFNRYWYANNNPYTNIDPDGRFARIPTSYWNPQAQEAAAYRAQSIARATASSGSTVADFTPVIGDIKGIYEAIQDPTFSNVAAAGVGLIPVVGDSAAKIIKMGGNVGGAVVDAAKSNMWTSTRSGSIAENAFRHFKDHGADFGARNAVEYVRMAQDFLHNPPSGVLSKTRVNGDVVRFDPVTNAFGVMDKTGAPRTFYVPDPGKHGYPTNLDYFNVQ